MTAAARLWILLSAWLVGTGWILSALHALTRTGYLLSLAPVTVAAIFWWPQIVGRPRHSLARWCHKLWHRFKRPAPSLFLLMLLLNVGGALVCRPANGDSDCYRIPRVFHWLGNEGWHWIHTGDSRMNIAGCGYEWLNAPIILLTGTDRWFFLPNLAGYLLLPGLIFSVFRQLGVHSRTAWWWAWVLAAGPCYVLQACSTLNDSLGVIYALAAVDLALRARKSGKASDLWLSLLAAGLLTGMKQTNLPLLLPWFIAAWPAARLLAQRPISSAFIVVLALFASVAPLAWMNWVHTGSWAGFPKAAEGQVFAWGRQQELTSPFWGLIGNLFCLPAQNLVPFFFPMASAWNHAMQQFVQTPLGAHFTQFEVFGRLGHSVSEPTAGIGLGVVGLTVISVLAVRRFPHQLVANANPRPDWYLRLLYLAPWLSLLVFMAKVGTYQNARQAAPYYVLLFPLLIAGARQAWLTRRRWWQVLALLTMMLMAAHLGFIRGRVLVPGSTIAWLQKKYPHTKMLSLLTDSYNTRQSLEAQRNGVKRKLPPDEKIVGYATYCAGAESGLWIPFGQRSVKRILPEDTPAELQKEGIRYVVVDDDLLVGSGRTIEQWAAEYHGSIEDDVPFTRDPGSPPAHLYLVCLQRQAEQPLGTVRP